MFFYYYIKLLQESSQIFYSLLIVYWNYLACVIKWILSHKRIFIVADLWIMIFFIIIGTATHQTNSKMKLIVISRKWNSFLSQCTILYLQIYSRKSQYFNQNLATFSISVLERTLTVTGLWEPCFRPWQHWPPRRLPHPPRATIPIRPLTTSSLSRRICEECSTNFNIITTNTIF